MRIAAILLALCMIVPCLADTIIIRRAAAGPGARDCSGGLPVFVDKVSDTDEHVTDQVVIDISGLTLLDTDVLIALVSLGEVDNIVSPAAFNEDAGQGGATGDNRRVEVSHHVVTDAASEPSSYTFTHSSGCTGGSCDMIGWIVQVGCILNSDPFDVLATAASETDSTPDSPSVNVTGDDDFVISLVTGTRDDSTPGWTEPGGSWTTVEQLTLSTGDNDHANTSGVVYRIVDCPSPNCASGAVVWSGAKNGNEDAGATVSYNCCEP